MTAKSPLKVKNRPAQPVTPIGKPKPRTIRRASSATSTTSTTSKSKLTSHLGDFIALLHHGNYERLQVVQNGLSPHILTGASEFYGISKKDVLEVVRIAPASENRWRKGNTPLPPDESDRIARLARVTATATDLLGSEDRAKNWLKRSIPALGNRTPLSFLATDAGSKLVEETLERSIAGVLG